MPNTIDDLLGSLRDAAPDRRLDQLEPAVWSRIDSLRANRTPAGSLRMQFAIAAGALVIGIAVGQATVRPAPQPSEAVLLSDDAILAPSIRLEGGA